MWWMCGTLPLLLCSVCEGEARPQLSCSLLISECFTAVTFWSTYNPLPPDKPVEGAALPDFVWHSLSLLALLCICLSTMHSHAAVCLSLSSLRRNRSTIAVWCHLQVYDMLCASVGLRIHFNVTSLMGWLDTAAYILFRCSVYWLHSIRTWLTVWRSPHGSHSPSGCFPIIHKSHASAQCPSHYHSLPPLCPQISNRWSNKPHRPEMIALIFFQDLQGTNEKRLLRAGVEPAT